MVPDGTADELLAEAEAAARGCDVAVVASARPRRSSRRASTARLSRCPAGRTNSSAGSRPPTRAPSSSSTPARRWSCRGRTRWRPCCWPGSLARRPATRSRTCCSAHRARRPAAHHLAGRGSRLPGAGRHAGERRAALRRRRLHRLPGLGAGRHRASVSVRPWPRLHHLALRRDHRGPAQRDRHGDKHRRARWPGGDSALREPFGRRRTRPGHGAGSPDSQA